MNSITLTEEQANYILDALIFVDNMRAAMQSSPPSDAPERDESIGTMAYQSQLPRNEHGDTLLHEVGVVHEDSFNQMCYALGGFALLREYDFGEIERVVNINNLPS
jgi:hypothetical protein